MGAVKSAIGDVVITFLWVFSASAIGPLTSIITSSYLPHLQLGDFFTSVIVTTLLLFILLFIFTLVGDALGGASFNPTALASFYAAGLGDDTLLSMALRFPAQVFGAIGGAWAIREFMPAAYKHMVEGPSLQVDLHSGCIAEGVLTFLITFVVLLVVLRGPKNSVLQTWLLAMSTVVLVLAGSPYTGPSMNPANAYGWAYLSNSHNTWEHFYVYWICPFIGAILAAWVFRTVVSAPQPTKEKKP
ncbi:hypothetical protein AMTRI_Chr02g224300 [Amborella trichopoda]